MTEEATFKLYGAGSSTVMKVVLMLEELGVSYQFQHVQIFRGEQFTPQFQAISPNARVPVLVDTQTGEALFESAAILIYLAERYQRFLPSVGQARYQVLQWLMLEATGISPTFGQYLHFTRFEPEVSDYAKARYSSQAIRLLDVVEARLQQREFLCNEQYSIADMAAFAWLTRLAQLLLPDTGRPNIARWCAAIAQRPAAQRMERTALAVRAQAAEGRAVASGDDMDRLFARGEFARR